MEIKIYDKEGKVIAVEKNDEGKENPGHYDINLSEKRAGIKFIKSQSEKRKVKEKN